MISLILLKLFTFSQILQGVPKLLHATVQAEKSWANPNFFFSPNHDKKLTGVAPY